VGGAAVGVGSPSENHARPEASSAVVAGVASEASGAVEGASLLGVVVVGAGGGAYWWLHRPLPLPPGIAYGNGRIEADPIDIATKFAGRIAELRVDEGDMVTAGQVVAVMDTRDMAASLKKSEAQVEQARKAIQEANANVDQTHTEVVLADQELERARTLLKNGWITRELFDQRQQKANSTRAGELAAVARVRQAEDLLTAAQHDVELYKVNIADNTLVAPRDGRIEYRIANVGEVFRRAARSSPCWISATSTWTSTCRPRRQARSRSALMPASCSTPIPTCRSGRK
jgi:multidrug resistance efflux pump